MSFDWAQYLNLARELAGKETDPPDEEARLRSAISRAYYAAFSLARRYLQESAGATFTGDAQEHGDVRREFFRSTDRRKRRIAQNLDRLRLNRNRADYEDTAVEGIADLATVSLMIAEDTVTLLSSFPPPRRLP